MDDPNLHEEEVTTRDDEAPVPAGSEIVSISRGGTADLLMQFRYDPLSGRLTALKVVPESIKPQTLFADEAGNQIMRRFQPDAIYRRKPDGTETRLWPRE